MLTTIILAAGQGKRMKSDKPKVLNQLGGKALIDWVTDIAKNIGSDQVVIVVGYKREMIINHLGDSYDYAVQSEQLGTGHAVMAAQGVIIGEHNMVVVLSGDTPLLDNEEMKELLKIHKAERASVTILTSQIPSSYKGPGRIIRSKWNTVERIIEEKDATAEELSITEGNTGTYCFNKDKLFSALEKVESGNAQGEYYLTDVIEILNKSGDKVIAHQSKDWRRTIGTNTYKELQIAEKVIRNLS